MERIRTKEDFENWKIVLMFLYGDKPKRGIDETNYINLFTDDYKELMLVVEEIEGVDVFPETENAINVTIGPTMYCVIQDSFGEKLEIIGAKESKLLSVYDAVVEFIKWYNQQK